MARFLSFWRRRQVGDPVAAYQQAFADYWRAAARRDTRRMNELYPGLQRALHAKLRAGL